MSAAQPISIKDVHFQQGFRALGTHPLRQVRGAVLRGNLEATVPAWELCEWWCTESLNPPEGFDDLALEEKIHYVQDLWDHIAESSTPMPLSPWQEEELRRRVRELEENPSVTLTWDEVLERVRGRNP